VQNIERNLKAQVKRFSQLIPEKTLKAQKVLSKKKLRTAKNLGVLAFENKQNCKKY
jgi:hypothetical protein